MNAYEGKKCEEVSGLLIGASVAALATLVPVALHQLGVLDHLPDPPFGIFDSDELTGSKMAHPLGIPDALPGLASYGVSLGLAVLARDAQWAQRLLAWKLMGDGAFAAVNTGRSLVRFGKLCSWCVGTALCTMVMVGAGRRIIWREVLRAW